MANINDRRSSKLHGDDAKTVAPDEAAVAHGAVLDQAGVEKAAGVQRHKDGSIRRITPGIRSLNDFFDPTQAERPMTRGDVVNVLSSLFYQERESRWSRRVIRWFQHKPQVASVLHQMANAHARGLGEVKRQMLEQVEHAQKGAAAFKAGAKGDN